MPYTVTVFEILIAGPSDVSAERQMIGRVIDDWNRDHSAELGLALRAVTWEAHSRPELGDDAQSILNRQLLDRCDAIIAVFGARLGTETPRAASGTAEEILTVHEAGKPAVVYFSSADLPRNHDREQLALLESFKADLRQRGLTRDFATVDELRELATMHIADLAHLFREQMLTTTVEQRGAMIEEGLSEEDERVFRTIGTILLASKGLYIDRTQLRTHDGLRGVSSDAIDDALAVLDRHGLIQPLHDHDSLYGVVRFTEHGFETFLRAFVPSYDAQVHAILSSIIRDGLDSDEAIATALGIPREVVEHVLDRFHSQDLLQTGKHFGGMDIYGHSPELRRHLERLEEQNASTLPQLARDAASVEKKACLALIDKGSISSNRERVVVKFVIRNEGDAPARDVSVEIQNEAGKPYAGGGKADTIAPEEDRTYQVAFSRPLTDEPGPEETRKFRIVVQFRDRHGLDAASYLLLIRGRGTKWRREIDNTGTQLSSPCAYIQPPDPNK